MGTSGSGSAPVGIWLRAGLIDPHHFRAMRGASPLGLYLYLHSIVRFSGAGAGETLPARPYSHTEAAQVLGCDERSVRRFFDALIAGGYVTARRANHGLHVTITKYDRGPGRSQRTAESEPTDSRVRRPAEPTDSPVTANGQLSPSQRTAESEPTDSRVRRPNKDARASKESIESIDSEEATPLLTPPVEPPEALRAFHAQLAGLPGYAPDEAFLAKLASKYGHLDLEEEALKIRGWLRSHPKRRCSPGLILNWLGKTAARAAEDAVRRPGLQPAPPGLPPAASRGLSAFDKYAT